MFENGEKAEILPEKNVQWASEIEFMYTEN